MVMRVRGPALQPVGIRAQRGAGLIANRRLIEIEEDVGERTLLVQLIERLLREELFFRQARAESAAAVGGGGGAGGAGGLAGAVGSGGGGGWRNALAFFLHAAAPRPNTRQTVAVAAIF